MHNVVPEIKYNVKIKSKAKRLKNTIRLIRVQSVRIIRIRINDS